MPAQPSPYKLGWTKKSVLNIWARLPPDLAAAVGKPFAQSAAFPEYRSVLLASDVIVSSGNPDPMALAGPNFEEITVWIGGIAFLGVLLGFYRWVIGSGRV
jgi:hypothetical protein